MQDTQAIEGVEVDDNRGLYALEPVDDPFTDLDGKGCAAPLSKVDRDVRVNPSPLSILSIATLNHLI